MGKKLQKQLIIAVLILVALAAGVWVDYYGKTKSQLTGNQTAGDAAYKNLIKSEDRAPLPVPAEVINKGRAIRLPILIYHHIGTAPAAASGVTRGLTISAQNFAAQIKWLGARGYSSVKLDDLYRLAEKQPVSWPKKPVMFTFDDGYGDAFENAVPVLQQYGYSGAFAIITQDPGQTQGTNTYATWQQIVLAREAGMEIICHTQNHFDGADPKYSAAYVYENLSGCQRDIAGRLGGAEPFMVYPYGHATAAYIEQAKRAGFVMGLTVHEGSLINLDDLMRLPRLRVNPGMDLEAFKKLLNE